MDDDPTSPSAPPGETGGGTPRWVKALAIVAVVVAALIGVLLLAGGEHAPGRHLPSDGGAAHTQPAEGHEKP